jgi:hypothetical protein
MNDETKKPHPQTDAEKARLAAALEAGRKQAAGLITTAMPTPANTAPVEAKPVEPRGTLGIPYKPGDALAISKGLQHLPQTPTSEAPKATTVQGDRGPPVDPDKGKYDGPSMGHDGVTTPKHEPKPANGQGGKKGGKKGKAPATPSPVAAAKPEKLGKAETAMAKPGNVTGYDLDRWQRLTRTEGNKVLTLVPPSKVHVLIARALRNGNTDKPINRPVSMNELSLAYGFTTQAHHHEFNVYDVGLAAGPVLSLSGDHKMNVFSRAQAAGLITINKGVAPNAVGGKNKAAYAAVLTAKGRAQVLRAAETQGFTVPKHLLPDTAPGKAADKALPATPTK